MVGAQPLVSLVMLKGSHNLVLQSPSVAKALMAPSFQM
jgi:hypothetical protein